MAKKDGFIEVTIVGLTIPKLVVSDKCELKLSDLKLNMSQTQDLTALCKSKAQVDVVIRQREKPLFDEGESA